MQSTFQLNRNSEQIISEEVGVGVGVAPGAVGVGSGGTYARDILKDGVIAKQVSEQNMGSVEIDNDTVSVITPTDVGTVTIRGVPVQLQEKQASR